jgi:hypothetical protein
MRSIYRDRKDDEITPKEAEQLIRLNLEELEDVSKYKKLDSEGELERKKNTLAFMKYPKEMRKLQRKKRSKKSKTKRKCRCKS